MMAFVYISTVLFILCPPPPKKKMTFVYSSSVLFILCPCRTAPSPRAVRPPGCPRWSWRREGCAPAGSTTPPPSTPLELTPPPSVVTKNVVILCEIKKIKIAISVNLFHKLSSLTNFAGFLLHNCIGKIGNCNGKIENCHCTMTIVYCNCKI